VSQVKVALDFCLSPRLVGVLRELYGHLGYNFLHLQALAIAGNTPDPRWAEKYKKFGGSVILSGDSKIAYKPHEALAFIDNGLISFFPVEAWASLKAPAQAAVFVYWWPKIAAMLDTVEPGTCWRLPFFARRGDLRLTNVAAEQLIIPPDILDAERKRRAS
jgi:hypothetical protein